MNGITDKVMVGIPKVNRPLPLKLQSWIDRTPFRVEFTDCLEQELARSLLVSKMINDKKYEYIFFVDSDMSPEDIDLNETIAIFYRRNLPVISCLTSTRGPHHKLLIFKKNPNITYPLLDEDLYKKDELLNVFAIGFGGCLIHRDVFSRIGLPWFRTDWDYIIPETEEVRSIGGKGMGADFFFSLRCKAEGVDLYLDCSQVLHHQELNPATYYYKKIYPDEQKMQKLGMVEAVV